MSRYPSILICLLLCLVFGSSLAQAERTQDKPRPPVVVVEEEDEETEIPVPGDIPVGDIQDDPEPAPTAPQPAPDPPSPSPPATTITTSATPAPQPAPVETVTTTTAVAVPAPPPPECNNTANGKKPEDWRRNQDGSCSGPPPHAGYCDATGKFYELEVDQYKTDPYWAAKGPWTDSYRDPITGSITCDFPKKEQEPPVAKQAVPDASVPQPMAEPPPRLKPEPKRKPSQGVPIPAPPG